MSVLRIPASELQAGDIIHYDEGNVWRLLSVSASGKSIDIRFVYIASDYAPWRVGETACHRMRASTIRPVERSA